MEFRITSQRGIPLSMSCSGTAGLDAALERMGMSVRSRATNDVVKLTAATGESFSVGWGTETGWVYVKNMTP